MTPHPGPGAGTAAGIAFVVGGLSIAAFTGALMKLLATDLSALQIAWVRFSGFALILLPVVAWRFGRGALRPARPAMQAFRGLTMSAATVLFILGARTIDFADAIAILYAYPFLLTALAVVLLKESCRWTGWIGVAGGFAGVLLVMRPGLTAVNLGALLVFLCAVVVSVQMLMNRILGRRSHPLVISFWGSVVAALSLTPFMPFVWQPVNPEQLWILLLMSAAGALSQLMIVVAFSRVEASTLAPFTYLEIVAAVFIGLAMFGTLPDRLSWAGTALIIASGLLVARSLPGRALARRNPGI